MTEKILWGPDFDNVVDLLWPRLLDRRRTWRKPAPDSDHVRNPAGVTDGWITGRDYMMHGRARYFTRAEWGRLQDFLDYASTGGTFRFVPDSVNNPLFYIDGCYLDEPFESPEPELEDSDMSQSLDLLLRHPSVDFNEALRGLMFEYRSGQDTTGFSFSRGSVGTFRSRSHPLASLVVSAASGVLRDRHYHGSERVTLLERLQTNVFSRSSDLSDAVWVKTNCTVNAATVTSPDGTLNRVWLQENNDVGQFHFFRRNTGALIDNNINTWSFYVRATSSTGRWVALETFDKAGATLLSYFDTTTGQWGGIAQHTTRWIEGPFYDPSFPGLPFWRVGVGFNSSVGASTPRVGAFLATGNGVTQYNGDGVSGVVLWGMDLVVGGAIGVGDHLGSHIPTVASAATRNADIFSKSFGFVPQPLWIYAKFVELGGILYSDGRVVTIGGTSFTQGRHAFIGGNFSQGYFMGHDRDAPGGGSPKNSVIGAGNAPIVGDVVEILGRILADGSVQCRQSRNGGAEVVAATSAAEGFAAAWAGPTSVWVNTAEGGAVPLPRGIQHIKIGTGTAIDTIPKARTR